VGWKKVPAGAKIGYVERTWSPDPRRGGDRLFAGPPQYRNGFVLQWINDEKAKLWFTEQVFDRNGAAPRPARQ
jgi:hypothetical protein